MVKYNDSTMRRFEIVSDGFTWSVEDVWDVQRRFPRFLRRFGALVASLTIFSKESYTFFLDPTRFQDSLNWQKLPHWRRPSLVINFCFFFSKWHHLRPSQVVAVIPTLLAPLCSTAAPGERFTLCSSNMGTPDISAIQRVPCQQLCWGGVHPALHDAKMKGHTNWHTQHCAVKGLWHCFKVMFGDIWWYDNFRWLAAIHF